MSNNSDLDFKSDDQLKQKQNPTSTTKKDSQTTENTSNDTNTIPNDSTIAQDISGTEDENNVVNEISDSSMIEVEKYNLAQSKADEYYNQMLRIAADADNERKQNSIDLNNARKNTKKSVLKTMLPFLTAINLSFAFAPKNDETVKFISQLTGSLDKITSDLKSIDVELLIPANGVAFDPITMQALNNSESDKPVVKSLASVGCIIDSQVVQPASVIIE
jgi:molecular chaperone GrpE